MAENLNINNLTLDDNSFKLLDEGTYRFRVAGHSIDYYSGNSTKIPANTQVVSCELEIPYTDESGNIATATVKNNLNIYKKALFAVRQFAECIGLCSEKGRESINLEDMDGKTGVCEITHRSGRNGKAAVISLLITKGRIHGRTHDPETVPNGSGQRHKQTLERMGQGTFSASDRMRQNDCLQLHSS